MTVKELRHVLLSYKDDTKVLFFVDWDKRIEINDIADQDDGTVLLGEDLPPEVYVTDYKYED